MEKIRIKILNICYEIEEITEKFDGHYDKNDPLILSLKKYLETTLSYSWGNKDSSSTNYLSILSRIENANNDLRKFIRQIFISENSFNSAIKTIKEILIDCKTFSVFFDFSPFFNQILSSLYKNEKKIVCHSMDEAKERIKKQIDNPEDNTKVSPFGLCLWSIAEFMVYFQNNTNQKEFKKNIASLLTYLFARKINTMEYFDKDEMWINNYLCFLKETEDDESLPSIVTMSDLHSNYNQCALYNLINYLLNKRYDSKYSKLISEIIKFTNLFRFSKSKIIFILTIIDDFFIIKFDELYSNKISDIKNKIKDDAFIEELIETGKKVLKEDRELFEFKNKFDNELFKIYWFINNYGDEDLNQLKENLLFYFNSLGNDEIKASLHLMDNNALNNETNYIEINFSNNKIIEKEMKDLMLSEDTLIKIKSFDSNCETWLNSGIYLYYVIRNNQFINDYSGALVYWFKCIELLIYNKVFITLSKRKNELSSFDFLISRFNELNCNIHNSNEFTFGSLIYLLRCKNGDNRLDSFLIEDCYRALNPRISIDKWKSIIEGIKELSKYRNKSAHTSFMPYSNAEKAKKIIFITNKIIKNLIEM